MLIGGVRSNMTALIIGAAVFVTAFAGLVYHQLDSWDLPSRASESDSGILSAPTRPPPDGSLSDTQLRKLWFDLYKPSVKPDTPTYRQNGAWNWDLKAEPTFREPLGEQLCIIDLDSRSFDEPYQIFGPNVLSWEHLSEVQGLALGIMNHWLYAKIHGYKYYNIATGKYADRRDSWKKPSIIAKILQHHKTCVYLDSDAIFTNLDLPFEWLMNYWDLNPANTSLALAYDPNSNFNKDKFGKVNLNTGFIVSHNQPKTFEIMDAWHTCPEPDSRHPECVEYRQNDDHRPTDQGGFGTFIRYDYADDIKSLDCKEANGFPASGSGCDGRFIRHVWTGKQTWLKPLAGQPLIGPYLELFHKEFQADKPNFYRTEEQLFSR